MSISTANASPASTLSAADAVERIREWIREQASSTPGFCGAHLKGSLLTAPAHAPWQADRDVDVNVLLKGADERNRFSEVLYRGILIDCAWIDEIFYDSAETVLANVTLAPNLAIPESILADPTGRLKPLAEEVARQYGEERWIRARCLSCRELAVPSLADLSSDSILDAAAALWKVIDRLGAQIAMAHLRSPTHRRCMIVSGEALKESGRAEMHERILELAGYSGVDAEQARRLVDECEILFDRAREKLDAGGELPPGTRFRPLARDYVLTGAREMIDAGFPREAMHWISAQLFLVLSVLLRLESADERPELQTRLFEVVAGLGLVTDEDRKRRAEAAAVVCRDVEEMVDDFLTTTFGSPILDH